MAKTTAARSAATRSPRHDPIPARRHAGALRARRKFLRYFPGGFTDADYLAWERDYKWRAHLAWRADLGRREYAALLAARRFRDVALRAVRIESRTNLLCSFEKMAVRDAVRTPAGARVFAEGLFDFLYGPGSIAERFARWAAAAAKLPRRQTRVVTWPVLTVFPFIAAPATHVFLKPQVTRRAATRYGFAFAYRAQPDWDTYASLLAFAETVGRDVADLEPRDMIDLQSFIWVQGSDEYA